VRLLAANARPEVPSSGAIGDLPLADAVRPRGKLREKLRLRRDEPERALRRELVDVHHGLLYAEMDMAGLVRWLEADHPDIEGLATMRSWSEYLTENRIRFGEELGLFGGESSGPEG
jgi:hypothetical protein